jgi:Rod binding domain-containing protein
MMGASTIPAILANLDGPVAALSQGRTVTAAKSGSKEIPKLVQAAGEFESMLLESLWKSMKETFTDPDNPDSDATLQSFDDWGMKSMAEAVGNSGGLGIKNMIIKYLEPTLNSAAPIPTAKA